MRSLWTTFRELFDVLPRGAKGFYAMYSVVTGLLALLDTAALALVVFVTNAFVTGTALEIPGVGKLPEGATVWVVVLVAVMFISKGVLAIGLHRIATRRFARYELEVGARLFESFARSSWEARSHLSTAEITRIVDGSMAATNRGFLLPLSQIPVNALTFVSVLMVLIVAQPLAAALAGVYFLLISMFIFLVISRRVRSLGIDARDHSLRVARIMTEMIETLKEITLRGKIEEVGEQVNDRRKLAIDARAEISFLGIVPKYTFESALIGGFLLVGGVVYLVQGPEAAIIAIGLFAATGFRMMPAMNSVQSSFTMASSNEAYARNVIAQLHAAENPSPTPIDRVHADDVRFPDRPSALRLIDVGFRYPGAETDALEGINLELPFGSRLAIVGPSGAGKSTLVDLILGLSEPSRGAVEIDGVPVQRIFDQWRLRVGYVPQRVALFDASIAQNIALTWSDDYDERQVRASLERAQLGELLDRPGGIEARIGERGSIISGGQQQRLGIARALYTDPLVLILDEATSALDTATEARVTSAMGELMGEVTFVTIAHRLATIRDYEQICYVEGGRIIGSGTFDELVRQVPAFAVQASLAGLLDSHEYLDTKVEHDQDRS